MSFEEAVTYAGQCDHVLVPYENERGVGNVSDVLSAIRTGDSVAVMIGPEGGFAKEEIEAAKKCAQLISLGRRILRTDTAAIAACTLVMMRLETADEDQNI